MIKYRIVHKVVCHNTYYKIQKQSVYKIWEDCIENGKKVILLDLDEARKKVNMLQSKKELDNEEGWSVGYGMML